MTLGNRVRCSGYIKPSHNYYEIVPQKHTEDGIAHCSYWEDGAIEGIEIEDFHSCDRFRTIDAAFSGIFVGTTTLCTQLNAEYFDNPYGDGNFRTYCDRPEKFAVVYYASNRKRLVPINRIKEESENEVQS